MKTTRTTTVEDSDPLGDDEEGTAEQITEDLFRITTVDRESAGHADFTEKEYGGLHTRTETEIVHQSPAPGLDDDEQGSVEIVGEDLYRRTRVTLSASTNFEESSWSRAAKYVRRKEVVTSGEGLSIAAEDGQYVRFDQLAPGIHRKTVTTYEDDFPDATSDPLIISEEETIRPGLVFYQATTARAYAESTDADAYATSGSGDWNTVKKAKTTNQYDQDEYEITMARLGGGDHTIYETRQFNVPGCFLIDPWGGVTVVKPVTRPVSMKIDYTYSTDEPTSQTVTGPPWAGISWSVVFDNNDDNYEFEGSGSNMVWKHSTTQALNAITTFRGQSVTSSSFEEHDDSIAYNSGARPQSGDLVDHGSRAIYVNGDFVVYENTSVYLNETFSW